MALNPHRCRPHPCQLPCIAHSSDRTPAPVASQLSWTSCPSGRHRRRRRRCCCQTVPACCPPDWWESAASAGKAFASVDEWGTAFWVCSHKHCTCELKTNQKNSSKKYTHTHTDVQKMCSERINGRQPKTLLDATVNCCESYCCIGRSDSLENSQSTVRLLEAKPRTSTTKTKTQRSRLMPGRQLNALQYLWQWVRIKLTLIYVIYSDIFSYYIHKYI